MIVALTIGLSILNYTDPCLSSVIASSPSSRHRIIVIESPQSPKSPKSPHHQISIELLSAGGLRLASKAGHRTRLPTVESSIGLTLFKLSVDHLLERHQSCSLQVNQHTKSPTHQTPFPPSKLHPPEERRKEDSLASASTQNPRYPLAQTSK